jgi:hypothetical protein
VLLLVAGCVHPQPVRQPSPAARGARSEATNAAPPPNTGTRAVAPAPPTAQSGQTAQPAAKPARVPSPGGASPAKSPAKPPSPAPPPARVPPASAAVPAPPALDLTSLEQRLRDTRAIGVFTKLSLKNQVDDLLAQFRAFHRGQSTITLAELRQRFEALLLKVVSLLQDGDAQLAAAVSSSREALWAVLVDPVKFAQL